MKLVLNRMHFPVTSLGPGRRLGLWFQGCSLACPGCLSLDTWDPEGRPPTTVDAVLQTAAELCDSDVDGVTISGGEPFEQPEALAALVVGIRRWSADLDRDLDILVYSGFGLHDLRAQHGELVAALDALIPEPFVAAEVPSGLWRGSGNQPLVLISELGRERFANAELTAPVMQAVAVDGELWMIGVPRRGDLARLAELLRARGVELEDVSWRP